MIIPSDDPLAAALVAAIRGGDVETLRRLLNEKAGLAAARIAMGDSCDADGMPRTLLHIAADWPGHLPNGAITVAVLIAAGAEVNARFATPGGETALHWAASSDDVAVLDALLDGGADIEAPGAVHTGGGPISDAVVFAQWKAARRLVERGARTTIWQAAALGLLDRVQEHFAGDMPPAPEQITNAFWHACRGGQRQTAEYLLGRGADLNWIGYGDSTATEAAQETGATEFVEWLRGRGGKSAQELKISP